MKKVILILGAMCLVAVFSASAFADVFVTGFIDKDKNKFVTETVFIDKAIFVGVKQVVKPSNSAEAQALKNDRTEGNTVSEIIIPGSPAVVTINPITQEVIELSPASPARIVTKDALIDAGSLDGAAGIVNVNQAPGSINNQGNAASVSYSADPVPIAEIPPGSEGETRFIGGTFLHAEASAEKILNANVSVATRSDRGNLIDASLVGVSGIVGINQAAGNLNNQNNAVALAVGSGAIASLTEADLGLFSAGNISTETATITTDALSNGALGAAAGIIGVNQSSGVLNNQANVVAVAVVAFAAAGP